MPYTVDSPNLPKNVKALPMKKRRQWVEVFNSVLSKCEASGGSDCEGKAFKQANGVVKDNEAPVEQKEGPGRGWWGPQKGGTHGAGSQAAGGDADAEIVDWYHAPDLDRQVVAELNDYGEGTGAQAADALGYDLYSGVEKDIDRWVRGAEQDAKEDIQGWLRNFPEARALSLYEHWGGPEKDGSFQDWLEKPQRLYRTGGRSYPFMSFGTTAEYAAGEGKGAKIWSVDVAPKFWLGTGGAGEVFIESEAFDYIPAGTSVNERMQANTVDKVYRTSWEGRDWLVVPTVMIKEGVLNGELVPAEELAKFPAAWNGRPFVIDHPRDGEEAVSANDPLVMDQYRAGFVFGTEYRESDKSVPAELWIDVERTKKLKAGPELLDRVLKGDQIEVSTGYFRDLEQKAGKWNGTPYNGVARNLRPDHLAALLDSVGACSWKDGCGCPRVNECEKECDGTCGSGMVWTEPTALVYQADKEGPGRGWWGPQKGGTHGAGSSGGGGIEGGELADDDLRWDSEDTILGSAIIDLSGGSTKPRDVTDEQVASFLKEHLSETNLFAIDSPDAIESIKITKRENGGNWLRVEVDVTPTEDAGNEWLDWKSGGEEWDLYHGNAREGKVNGQVKFNVATKARTPTYSGTSDGEWTAPSLDDYARAYDGDAGSGPVSDRPAAFRRWVAAHSLLGDPNGETFRELCFFPVVGTDGKLYGAALRAVLGGRGSQAQIPEAAKGSAQATARRLLEDKFGMQEQKNKLTNAWNVVAKAISDALGINGQDNSQEDVEAMAKSKADMVADLCKRLEIAEDENGEGLNALSADTLRKILNAFGAPPDEEEPKKKPDEEDLMPEEQSEDAEPETQAEAEDEEEEEPQANEQPCAEIAANQAVTIAALERRIAELEKRSEASADVVRQYQEAQRREKDRLISDLAANEACAFDKDELKGFDVPKLQKLARSLTPRSYAGQEGGPTANREKDTRPIVAWSGNHRAGKEK